jgi:hypothetical protein
MSSEEITDPRKTSGNQRLHSRPHLTFNIIAKRSNNMLFAQSSIGDKPWLLTINTGVSVMIARPDIMVGLPQIDLSMLYVLQMASGEILLILKEALVKLTLRGRPLAAWAFVANITDKFILGLDVLCTHDASLDLRYQALRLGDEEVPLWCLGA